MTKYICLNWGPGLFHSSHFLTQFDSSLYLWNPYKSAIWVLFSLIGIVASVQMFLSSSRHLKPHVYTIPKSFWCQRPSRCFISIQIQSSLENDTADPQPLTETWSLLEQLLSDKYSISLIWRKGGHLEWRQTKFLVAAICTLLLKCWISLPPHHTSAN